MTADPLLTDADRRHLYELLSDAWDRGRVGEPSCDELYAEARELVTAAWERRRPELDALLELEQALRDRTQARRDLFAAEGADDDTAEPAARARYQRAIDRRVDALATLDRIRRETP